MVEPIPTTKNKGRIRAAVLALILIRHLLVGSGPELKGVLHRAGSIAGCTFITADTLMIPDCISGGNRNIHGTGSVTFAAMDTGLVIPLQWDYPEEVEYTQKRSVGTEVFTERPFHKQ
jgi:hypothetical protein